MRSSVYTKVFKNKGNFSNCMEWTRKPWGLHSFPSVVRTGRKVGPCKQLTDAETGFSDCHAAMPPSHGFLLCSFQSPQTTTASLQDQVLRYPLPANSPGHGHGKDSHTCVTRVGDALDLHLSCPVTAPNSSVDQPRMMSMGPSSSHTEVNSSSQDERLGVIRPWGQSLQEGSSAI